MSIGLILKRIIILIMFFSVAGWSVVLDTDTFGSNIDGWSGTNVTWDNVGKRLFINTDNTATKTYDFGSTYANKNVTITLTATKVTTWETTDRIQITANGTQVYNSITGGSISFGATLDGSGKLVLQIMPNTNASAEDLYIDNISIDYYPPPVFSITNVDQNEGNSNNNLNFTVTLSGTCVAGKNYTVNYATSDGTATAGSDYTATSGTVTFNVSTTGSCGTKTISVPIIGDTDYESDESFLLTLSNPTNATISPSGIYATGVIWNDDTLPVFSIDNVSTTEGNSGTKNLTFTLTLTGTCAANKVYTVDYATSDGTATVGSDYTATSGTATYSRTTTGACGTKTINVPIVGDTVFEADEAFLLTLSNPIDAILSLGSYIAVGTITNDDAATNTITPFSMRYKKNLKGNMKIIGNTVLQAPDDGNSNAGVDLRYTKLASDGSNTSIFNSSSADLNDTAILPTATNPNPAKVKWAGLYWSGYLHTYEAGDGAQTQYTGLTSNAASIHGIIQNHTVKFRIDSTSYDISNHTVLGEILYLNNGSYASYSYGCFADVTNLMQNSDPRGTYSVANIPSMEGQTNQGSTNDGLGNSGAWTLVVIYENTSVGEKTRNATVFDGFVRVYDVDGNSDNGMQTANDVNINLSGFKTPKGGIIDSTLSVFANEGDRYIPTTNSDTNHADQLRFTNLDGSKNNQTLTLSSNSGTNNYFDSSITGVPTRTPALANNNGIDIHTDALNSIMGTNQTKAQITLTTAQDTYYPVMVSFATELYMPKLCYDYTATLDDELMQKGSSGRTFMPHRDDGTLKAKVFIRSLEGDFPYLNSNLKVTWKDVTTSPSANPPNFTFNGALVQNPNVYGYDVPLYIDSSSGVYYIGIDRSGYHGVIDPFKSLYAISSFESHNLSSSSVEMNADVNASLALDESDPSSLTNYTFSTSDGTLQMCEGTFTYNPMWYQFNVENDGAVAGDYSLGTQVTGTPYNLRVVSYTKNGSGEYTVKTPYTGGVEIEPFEVPSFQSLGGYDSASLSFDRICEDSSNGKLWDNGKRKFVVFNNKNTMPLGISALDNKYAMRNAGVRLWALTADYNGDGKFSEIALNNNCSNTDGNCFRTLYANDAYYKTINTCDTACGGSSDESCYQCLRKYYSQPICSRDNFSVRPYGVELTAKSINTEIQKNDMASSSIHNLISGLAGDYTTHMVAKSANNINPFGYYFRKLSTQTTNIANDVSFDSTIVGSITEFFGIKMDNSKLNIPDDPSKCADSNHKRFEPLDDDWILKNDNVGNYDIVLVDKDWTIVDQARYAYKAPASVGKNDCIPNDTTLKGCDVQSFEVNSDSKFNKIPVKFVPAKIDVQSLAYGSYPTHGAKWAYMNNLVENHEMGAQFAGAIVATNAASTPQVTTNFTAGCFSQDVNLYTQYTSSQLDGKDIKTGNTDGTLPQGSDTIYLHYAYSSNGDSFSSVTPITQKSTADTTDGVNFDDIAQSQVTRDKFLDTGTGSLLHDLRYNISKLYYAAVKPIEVLFVKLNSELLDDGGNAVSVWKDGVNTHPITDEKKYFTGGVADIDTNSFRFIYGRVYTDLESFGVTGKPVRGANTSSSFNAVAYSSTDPVSDVILSSVFGNNVSGLPNWYLVKSHSINASDGQIDEVKIKSAEQGNPTISPSTNIVFDRPSTSGSTKDVTYSYSGTRSNKVVFDVYTTAWLKYNNDIDKAGLPQFVLNFVDSGYNWVGKGNTGNVINLPVSPNAKYR